MSEQFDTAELQDANLIIYGVKFPWDKPEDTIHMLGQQAATSTTDTPTLTAVATKKNTFHASGTRAETFVVDSYWKKRNDYVREGIQRSVKENRPISLWRIDFNQKTADPAHPGKFVVPATYAQCYANGMPNTEAVNNLNHANITYEVNGSSSEGVLRQDELDPELYTTGLDLAAFAHNTDVGGTADPKPTPLDQYLKENGGPVVRGSSPVVSSTPGSGATSSASSAN